MLLAFALLLANTAIDRTSAAPSGIAVPGEIMSLAQGIRIEKSRLKRLELLAGLMADVKSRVNALPDSIGEEDVPRVEILYELNILLGGLKPETINPATCPNLLRAMRQMTNPSGLDETALSSPGRLALDVVKSVCAP